MKKFTVYRQTVDSVNEVVDLINRFGWNNIRETGNILANLKLETQCLFGEGISFNLKKLINDAYKNKLILPVAEIDCDCLEDAFRLSNSINCMWTENAAVTMLKTDSEMYLSSTSSGDIFKDNDTGEFFMVLSIGFTQITFK